MVQVSWGSRSTTAILPHASFYGHTRKLLDSSESDLQSSVGKGCLCPSTQNAEGPFQLPLLQGSFPRTQCSSWLQVPHVKQARGISKEGSEMRICITSKEQREEKRNLSVYQPAPPSPMRNKIKRKKRFLCASCASVKFSKDFLLVLDQVQHPCGQSWVCLDYLLAKGFPLQSSV